MDFLEKNFNQKIKYFYNLNIQFYNIHMTSDDTKQINETTSNFNLEAKLNRLINFSVYYYELINSKGYQ